jgi:uncharacterized protein (TIGR02677 family)
VRCTPLDRYEKVTSAKYLSEDPDEYRAIMQFFYLEHRVNRNFVSSTDIYEYVRLHFPSYTEERCNHHLDSLREWGTIGVLPRRQKPRDINDARRRPKFYYAERMALRLEEARFHEETERTAQLNPSALDDMLSSLEALLPCMAGLPVPPTMTDQERVYSLWTSAFRAFNTFSRSASLYMHRLLENQAKSVNMEQYDEYRLRVRNYLKDYVSRLFEQRDKGRYLLRDLLRASGLLADCCAAHDQRMVDADGAKKDLDELARHFEEQIGTMVRFFARGDGGFRSDVDVLIEEARGWVVEISDHVQRLSAQQRGGSIHEQRLLHLARRFADLPEEQLEQVHWLAQVAFGATLPLHFRGNAPAPTDEPSWSRPPAEVPLQTVKRGTRQRLRPDTTQDRSVEEAIQMENQAEEKRRHVEELEELFGESGVLDLTNLHLEDSTRRGTILKWVARAQAGSGSTLAGHKDWQIKLEPVADVPTGVITAEDGYLYRIPYRLRLQKGRSA